MWKWTVWFDFASERFRSGGCSSPFGGGVKITWSKPIMRTGVDNGAVLSTTAGQVLTCSDRLAQERPLRMAVCHLRCPYQATDLLSWRRLGAVHVVVAALPTITWTAEKHVHPGCQKPHRSNKARSMGFCHACDMLRLSRISVQHCIVAGEATGWPHGTRNKKKKTLCRGNILHLLQQINSKQLAQVKNIMATVFWGHKCVLRGYALTAECCGKLGRLPETIPCQTPGLLPPDVVILYDYARPHNATWICTLLRCDSWKIIEHPPYFRSRARWFSSLSNR